MLKLNYKPLVSIGVPTFNRPDGLRRTLSHIFNQTYSNLEVIVSDNNSPGGNIDTIIRDFAISGKKIRYFRQKKNQGAVFNFEFVFKQATGQYFMWAADDDYFESKNLIENLQAACANINMAFPDFNVQHTSGRVVRGLLNKIYGSCLTDQDYLLAWCKYGYGYPYYGMYNLDNCTKNNVSFKFDTDLKYYSEGTFLHRLFIAGNVRFVPNTFIRISEGGSRPDNLTLLIDHSIYIERTLNLYTSCDSQNIKNYVDTFLESQRVYRLSLCESLLADLRAARANLQASVLMNSLNDIERHIGGLKSQLYPQYQHQGVKEKTAVSYTTPLSHISSYREWISTLAKAQCRLYYRDQTPESLESLAELVQNHQPTKIIELGSLFGLSLRTWLSTQTDADIVAIDLSFRYLRESQKLIPIDLSRVTLLEQDILKTDFRQLWEQEDKVLLYVDAHDQPNVPIMEYVLNYVVPLLPVNSLVVVDDLWYSPTVLEQGNVQAFFEQVVNRYMDPLHPIEAAYAPYWEGGSFIGFLEVIPLMKWVFEQKIKLKFQDNIKFAYFQKSQH
ncbi:glycosyltransferase [Sodalinema gerasimenkoae]|uniref:glycosyltransferase n=1 Tax=Sodalinema gerasimenkoae TaxID=2862348 RepID=UPI001357C9A1|nr:glycosyltransferase [Sodalinema gerasimenkoae]